jgi:hypothetical protein
MAPDHALIYKSGVERDAIFEGRIVQTSIENFPGESKVVVSEVIEGKKRVIEAWFRDHGFIDLTATGENP